MLRQGLIFAIIVVIYSVPNPPFYNYSYQVEIQQTTINHKGQFHVKGNLFYDALNHKERKDLQSSNHNTFCNSVLPEANTPCQELTTQGNRWIIFPQKSKCCLCCTTKHGCGILRPDWLRDSQYLGQFKIDDTIYDKWHKTGATTEDYFYATTDNSQKPRRLDESGKFITDYNLQTYERKDLSSSIFAVPVYCNQAKPIHCPVTSLCELLRNDNRQLSSQ